MNVYFKKETNLDIGQSFFGIVAISIYTYEGVHPIVVSDIDWNKEEVIFDVEQPCRTLSCSFDDFCKYVFEKEEDANTAIKTLSIGEGLCAC